MPDSGQSYGFGPEQRPEAKLDRRAARTRRALLNAFIELVSERKYDSITTLDLVERANVGRSTFYKHFQTKDDLLLQSMQWMFTILADASLSSQPIEPLKELAEHFWSNRRLAQAVLSPSLEWKLRQALGAQLLKRMREPSLAQGGAAASKLMATGVAASQLAILGAWTKGEVAATADDVARAIRHTASELRACGP